MKEVILQLRAIMLLVLVWFLVLICLEIWRDVFKKVGKDVKLTRYRAVAVDIELDGHPVQCITSSLNDVADWAHKIQQKYKCAVDIYVTEERLLRREEPAKDA